MEINTPEALIMVFQCNISSGLLTIFSMSPKTVPGNTWVDILYVLIRTADFLLMVTTGKKVASKFMVGF